jgi:hypothetical protein
MDGILGYGPLFQIVNMCAHGAKVSALLRKRSGTKALDEAEIVYLPYKPHRIRFSFSVFTAAVICKTEGKLLHSDVHKS